MNVVSYANAAKLAGVTRQRIYNIRKDIEKGLSKHQFLAYDSDKKRMGIDTDHPDWAYFCEKNKNHPNKKKESQRSTGKGKETKQGTVSDSLPDEQENGDKVTNFVLLCLSVSKKYMSQEKYNKFKNEISVEYKRVNKK